MDPLLLLRQITLSKPWEKSKVKDELISAFWQADHGYIDTPYILVLTVINAPHLLPAQTISPSFLPYPTPCETPVSDPNDWAAVFVPPCVQPSGLPPKRHFLIRDSLPGRLNTVRWIDLSAAVA